MDYMGRQLKKKQIQKVHGASRPTKPTPKRLNSIVTVKSEKITKNIFAMADIEHV
jgi:hypothetical protein